jgi:hypothetical protein
MDARRNSHTLKSCVVSSTLREFGFARVNSALGGVLATLKPLPEVLTPPTAATLPEQNNSLKKDNLRLIRQLLESYYVVRLFRPTTRDKLSITATKPDILRFLHKLQIAVFYS